MDSAIGIDIGGTKISMALGTRRGKLLANRKIQTRVRDETRECIDEMILNLEFLIRESKKRKLKLQGLGVCLPGAVNSKKGIVPRSPHLPGWKDFPLRAKLQSRFHLPVLLANDANAAAVGEAIFGQAKGLSDFIYMTVSTGIGAGIYVHGKLLEGVSYGGGEVGHTIIVPSGNLCDCGHHGCLEAYASGTAMAKYASRALKKGRKSKILMGLAKNKRITAKVIAQAARIGDRLALETFEHAGYYLGIGIANALNVLNPQKVILGGGVMKSAPREFWKTMMKSVRANAWPEAFQAVKIVPSKLKSSVGDLGALALVFESLS